MHYSITFSETDYNFLVNHLFEDKSKEQAAYILCRPSFSNLDTRFIVREIIPVQNHEIIESSEQHMLISSKSFLRALKKANNTKQCFFFVHSHPHYKPDFSQQDDKEEAKLFRTAYNRISTKSLHGSILFSSPENPKGRIWLEDGSIQPISLIRSIGKRFRFYTDFNSIGANPQFFDRQIKAFGIIMQKLLRKLTIGIVGVGGTGSAIAEQLIRLGVGTLIVSDGQVFEKSNVNRVYGSRVSDDGKLKIDYIKRLANDIGIGTEIISTEKNIVYESSIKLFRNCDIIFGCTDDEWGRSLLNRLAIYYLIPVFDMGVKIDSDGEIMKSIEGRVTTLLPNEACLFCRERINPVNIENESLSLTNPDEAKRLRREGYIPTLAESAPAVIPFTTSIASAAISEFIHRLTGHLGEDRISSEVIYQFHQLKIRTNHPMPKNDCFCGNSFYYGRADVNPFLDTTWIPE